jgi:DNA repair protein RecO (recombination protein O)
MNIVSCILYKNDNRDLHLLSQCDMSLQLRHLADDLEKMSVAMSAVGLVDGLPHNEEPNEQLFDLLTAVLRLTNDATNSPFPALYLFEVRLLAILGFRPAFHSCPRCGLPVLRSSDEGIPAGRFGLGYAGVFCATCTRTGHGVMPISLAAVRALQSIQDVTDASSLLSMPLPEQIGQEVSDSLRLFLRHNVEGFRDPRSEGVFATIRETEK